MTVTLVAPDVAQVSVVPLPAVIPVGLAENDEMTGIGICEVDGIGAVQPASPAQASSMARRMRPRGRAQNLDSVRLLKLRFPLRSGQSTSMRSLSIDCRLQRVGSIGQTKAESRMRRDREVVPGPKLSIGNTRACDVLHPFNDRQGRGVPHRGHSAFAAVSFHIA